MIINEMRLTDAEGHTEGGVGRFIVPIKQCTGKVFPPFWLKLEFLVGKFFHFLGKFWGYRGEVGKIDSSVFTKTSKFPQSVKARGY